MNRIKEAVSQMHFHSAHYYFYQFTIDIWFLLGYNPNK